MLLIDDSLVSLLALLPGVEPGSITLFYPRSGRTRRATLDNQGVERTEVNGDERQLRHITLSTGDHVRHLWYDSRGRLIKVEIPFDGLTAIRSSRR